jgi:hypothetical protein
VVTRNSATRKKKRKGKKHARRELAASLTLARPDSPIRAPIEARMFAIDAELAERIRRADG